MLIWVDLFAADSMVGRVVKVTDGDTVTVLVKKTDVIVRLAEIDAPEMGQPWGKRAKQGLAALVFGKQVEFVPTIIDRYGRTVANLYVDGRLVGRDLIRMGHAWVYRTYRGDSEIMDLEEAARSARHGLWGLAEAERMAPWDWRLKRPLKNLVPPAPATRKFVCGSKQSCREMKSCAEAKYYLTSCNRRTLDGDRDGVPCEAICP